MKELEIEIKSILGGIAPSYGFAGDSQYGASLGVDPDFPATDSQVQPSGLIRPTAMEKFSGSTVDAIPLWITTTPKQATIYAFLNNGTLVGYNSSLSGETKVGSLSTCSGNGMEYYDNYLYLGRNTDIARYGPLDGSATLTSAYWTSTLSLASLANTSYPSIRGVQMPNHPMHRHTDDALYFIDVQSSGYGILCKIKTTKTTAEGDTNYGSAYNVLDFDAGLYPTALSSYQTNLAVGLIEGTNTTIRQKNAKVAFWDTTSDSFSLITEDEFPDPLITALLNVNGVLYVASGSAAGGCRISRYAGGYTHEVVWYNADVYPPLQGAFADLLNRVVFGTGVTYPESAAAVFGIGSMAGLGGGVHGILKASPTSGAAQYVTSLAYVQNSALPKLAPIIGWTDGSGNYGIDKLSSTYGVWVWRSQTFRIGENFEIYDIEIPLSQAVASNMTITPKIYVDNLSANTSLRTINTTNFAASDKKVNIMTRVIGKQDFVLELRGTGTALLTVGLPIKIKLRTIQ